MFRAGRRWAALTSLLALLALAACGGDDNATTTTAAAGQATTTQAATGTTSGGGATTTRASTGTTSGGSGATTTSAAPRKATGEPIRIGFTNVEGGAISIPDWRIGWEQGVKYVNEVLGGVNGRPIETMLCLVDGSPEKSIDCGNKFVEANIPLVVQGVDFGGSSMLPILKDAGIPVTGHIAWDPIQRAALDTARYFGAASPAYGAAQLKNAKDAGINNFALFLADVPASHQYEETVLQPTAQKLGMRVKLIYYDAASVDWNVVVQTALAENPDGIGSPAAQEADCIGFMQAARSAGYTKPVYPAACTAFIAALGDAGVGARTYSDLWLVANPDEAPPNKQAEIRAYNDWMTKSGLEQQRVGLAVAGFSDAVTLQRVLSGVSGELTKDAIKNAIFTAEVDSFLGNAINCDGTAWKGETNCTAGILFYEVQKGGTRKLISGGYLDVSEFQPS